MCVVVEREGGNERLIPAQLARCPMWGRCSHSPCALRLLHPHHAVLAHWQAQSILEFYHYKVQLSAYRSSLTLFVELRRGEPPAKREDEGLCTPANQVIPRKRGVASPLPANRASPPKRKNNRQDNVVCVAMYVCICASVSNSSVAVPCSQTSLLQTHTSTTNRPVDIIRVTTSNGPCCLQVSCFLTHDSM